MPQIQIDFNKLVDQLKEIAGPLASQAWEIMVRQEIAYGITQLILSGIWLVVLIVSIVLCRRVIAHTLNTWDDWDSRDSSGTMFAYVLLNIALVACVIVSLGTFGDSLQDGFMHLYNPYFYAIHDLSNIVKNKGV